MTQRLATQLVIATAMAALTVIMHLLGLSLLIAATNRHSNRLQSERALARQAPRARSRMRFISRPQPMPPSAIAILYQGAGESLGRLRAPTVSSCLDGRQHFSSQLSRVFAHLSTTGRAPSAEVHSKELDRT
jgi:hypothetical protein